MRLSQNLIERYSYLLHLVGWATFVSLPFVFFPWDMSTLQRPEVLRVLPSKLAGDALLIVFFYLNLNRLTPLALRKHTLWPILLGALGCLLLLTLAHLPLTNGQPYPVPPDLPPGFVKVPLPAHGLFPGLLPAPQLLSFVLVISGSTGLALWRDLVHARESQQQMNLEKVTAELAMLKLQISPHFLFNTLNNIRYLTTESSVQAEEAVIKLSQLLRYIIYQSHYDLVSLDQEITHLHNYIDLQKMRLVNPDRVRFSWQGDISKKTIVPLLLIPFVENAFKHGQHSQHQALIRITLAVNGQTLVFRTQNPYFDDNLAAASNDSGIGIQNVRRRLSLHYPGRHELTLDQQSGLFEVYLQVELAA